MTESITKADLARRLGVSKTAVTKLVTKGLPVLSDGRLDLVDSVNWIVNHASTTDPIGRAAHAIAAGFRRADDDASNQDDGDAPTIPDLDAFSGFINDLMRGRYASQAEADKIKANALAALRVIEFMKTQAALCTVKDVAVVVGAQVARVRTRLLAMPVNTAPALARTKTPQEAYAIVDKEVREALEELSCHRPETIRKLAQQTAETK